ncbi:hypothetical protein ACI1UG_06510 [Lactococcus garvieae]|uniref:hypothetical protein n=1 Tax=Lactococcus garvieae TaxID=1363 RepID=UPI003854B315
MMLEYNLYDNFNPNKYAVPYENPSAPNVPAIKRLPLPKPKARGVAMNYELWQTGYKTTSYATLSTKVDVGDVVQILLNEPAQYVNNKTIRDEEKEHILYIVKDVDDDRVSLQNYYWYAIEGVEYPISQYRTSTASGMLSDCWNILDSRLVDGASYIYYADSIANLKLNVKSETTDSISVAKKIFKALKVQPYVRYNLIKNRIEVDYGGRSDKEFTTRIDGKNNVTIETEVDIERSNYNYLSAYIKDSQGLYNPWQDLYTLDDKNNVINLKKYTGDGSDLPSMRVTKTVFYDDGVPTDGEIRAEISQSSFISNIYFNQSDLQKLYVNDRVNIWYDGTSYTGHIADRCFSDINGIFTDRLLFVERGQRQ